MPPMTAITRVDVQRRPWAWLILSAVSMVACGDPDEGGPTCPGDPSCEDACAADCGEPDPCAGNPCAPGSCMADGEQRACLCPTGWMAVDRTCVDIDDCAGDPCGAGTCTDLGAGAYGCACDRGHYDDGATCAACPTIAGCTEVVCTSPDDVSCEACAAGFEHDDSGRCAAIDPCDPDPCAGGICQPDGVDYGCACAVGDYFDGTTCVACGALPRCEAVTCAAADDPVCTRCEPGYQLDGGACVDPDDCAASPCGLGHCQDTGPGTYACSPSDRLDGAIGGRAERETPAGIFAVEVGPGAFVDADGAPANGALRLTVVVGGFDGALVTSDRAFDPMVTADIALIDDTTGAPLQLAPGADATLVLPLPVGVADADGDARAIYRYDPALAVWHDEATGVVRRDGEVVSLVAAVSHFSWYGAGEVCPRLVGCRVVDCEAERCASCEPGYALVDGLCSDIDDCAGVGACGAGACIDQVGGYVCACPDGTFGDGTAACTACDPSGVAGCSALTCAGPGESACTACAPGWRWSAGTCTDIDDCAARPCGVGTCTDTGPNTWSCACPDGHFGDGTTGCTACPASAVTGCSAVTCTGPEASSCAACDNGYRLEAGSCVDVDDCAGVTACGAGRCVDKLAGFTCDCPDGAFGDGTTRCTACTASSDRACTAVTCTRAGASTCTACATGYALVNGRCVDVDDCAGVTCGAGGRCVDGVAAFTCNCPDGAWGDGTTSCSACAPSTVPGCTAVTCAGPGASTCSACADGWTLSGTTCLDVDDCAGTPCGPGRCTDTGAGAWTCDCPTGTFGTGTTGCTACSPISHCASLSCTAAGASVCSACQAGYELSGGRCVSTDDCIGHHCGAGTCIDGAGTYTCACPTGTYGSGTTTCTACDSIPGCDAVACTGAADEQCLCTTFFDCSESAPACVIADGIRRCGSVDACTGDDDAEPDDGPSVASAAPWEVALPRRICGGPNGTPSSAETDWFQVTLTGELLKVVLTAEDAGVELYVRVWDQQGAFVGDGDDQHPVFLLSPPAGVYFIEVLVLSAAPTATVDYTLTVDRDCFGDFGFCPPEAPVCDYRSWFAGGPTRCVTSDVCPELGEHEPDDDDPRGATELTGPRTIETNEACGGIERDWYRFDVGAGETPRVTLEWGTFGFDFDLNLYDEGGDVVAQAMELEPFREVKAFTGLTAGTYFLEVLNLTAIDDYPVRYWLTFDLLTPDGACPNDAFGFCPAEAPECNYVAGSNPLAFRCESSDQCTGDDAAEPADDGPRGATLLEGPIAELDRAICSHGAELDWYTTLVEPGEIVRARLEWEDPDADVDLYLLDRAFNFIAESAVSDGNVEALSLEDAPPGIYYILVQGYDGAPSAAIPYHLVVDHRPCDLAFGTCPTGTGCVGYHGASRCEPVDECVGDDAREPADDAIAGATAASPGGSTFEGVICGSPGDRSAFEVDWYSIIKGDAGEPMMASITWDDPLADLDLVVRDAAGNTLARGVPSDEGETVTFSNGASDTYYVGVTRWDGPPAPTAYELDLAACGRAPDCLEASCSADGVPRCQVCDEGFDLDPLGSCVERDDCAPAPCQHGGECYDVGLGYLCDCAPGWGGAECDVFYDECRTTYDCDYTAPRCTVDQGLGTCTAITACLGDDAREPLDDQPDSGTALAFGVPTSAKVCDNPDELDWFHLSQAGEPIELVLDWSASGADLDVVALTDDGSVLYDAGATVGRPERVRIPAGFGRVDVGVYAYDGAPLTAVDYTLTATAGCESSFECPSSSPVCDAGECTSADECGTQSAFEPFDDGPNAVLSTSPLRTHYSSICGAVGTPSEAERDWFRVELTADQPLFATLGCVDDEVDLDIALYDGEGEPIATGTGARPETLSSLEHATGVHFIEVRSLSVPATEDLPYCLELATCEAIPGCAETTCTTREDATCARCADGYEADGAGGCRDRDDCAPDPCNGYGCQDLGPNSFQCDLAYHGGRVMHEPIVAYPIWYGDWSGREAPKILTDLITALGGSPRWAATSWWGDAQGRAPSQSITVSREAVHDAWSQGTTLAMPALRDIVADAITGGLPSDPNGIYVVFTSPDVGIDGLCTAHCGWHDQADIGGEDRVLALVPDASSACPEACGVLSPSPNGDPGADAMAAVLVQVLEGAATDPGRDGWFDGIGLEIADRCAWRFGFPWRLDNGALANARLGSRDFLLTASWIRNGWGCATEFEPPYPFLGPSSDVTSGTNPRLPVVRPNTTGP